MAGLEAWSPTLAVRVLTLPLTTSVARDALLSLSEPWLHHLKRRLGRPLLQVAGGLSEHNAWSSIRGRLSLLWDSGRGRGTVTNGDHKSCSQCLQ